MPTKEELKKLQELPLELKVAKTQQRIREWVEYYGEDHVYVSFSGGKDSTVLLHIARGLYPNMPAVFINTGLEYPEIQSFVRNLNSVEILIPKMPFTEVIKKYGYPFISKDVSQIVYECRNSDKRSRARFEPDSEYNQKYKGRFSVAKWKDLLETDFKISHMCCKVMKKDPAKRYEKNNNCVPIIGTLAEESKLRTMKWTKKGCNAFDNKRPISQPMSFWTENDVLQYLYQNNIQIASVYGDIVISNDTPCKYATTGCSRTGCVFCGFGAHLEKESRFVRLKETHPKQYNYCIGGVVMT